MKIPRLPIEAKGKTLIYLKSEEMIIAEEPVVITTVLGSCIAVAMYRPQDKIGAICHALLPDCKTSNQCPDGCTAKYKYVACVIPEMLARLRQKGVNRNGLKVKLFGGADMKMLNPLESNLEGVGRQNAQIALKTIEFLKLELITQDIGGDFGRKLFFFTDTGRVLLKRLGK